jgi:hypothetical protein
MDKYREPTAGPARAGQSFAEGTTGRIRRAVWVWLSPTADLRIPVRAYFDYDQADPCAVRVSFCLPQQRRVTWVFARDLLADGLSSPAGAGDIRIAPHQSVTGRSLRIMLTPPSGAAVVELHQRPVRAFLRDTEQLVPRGQENTDIDAFLKKCLNRT